MAFCKVTLTFESMDEILWCDHSNESYWAVLSCGTVYYAVQGDSNFWVCGRNPMMWPFKWKLSACTFTWCYLFLTILENEIWKFGRNLPLTKSDSERVNYSSATTWFVAQKVQTWVVKGATVLFDMFCSKTSCTLLLLPALLYLQLGSNCMFLPFLWDSQYIVTGI